MASTNTNNSGGACLARYVCEHRKNERGSSGCNSWTVEHCTGEVLRHLHSAALESRASKGLSALPALPLLTVGHGRAGCAHTGEATRKRDETAWLLHINLLEKEKDLLSSVSGLQIRHADFTILLIRCIVAG